MSLNDEGITGDELLLSPERKSAGDLAQTSRLSTGSLTDSPNYYLENSDSPASSIQSPPTPVPQTPLFSPNRSDGPFFHQQQSPGSEDDRDLPKHLLDAGWRKVWSKRENRFYYFNKLTQQSVWDLTELLPPAGTTVPSRKRSHPQHSGGGGGQTQSAKRFVPSTDWDLSVVSNVRMDERLPTSLYPPHPEVEGKRNDAFTSLLRQLKELTAAKGIELQADTFIKCCLMELLMPKIEATEEPPTYETKESLLPARMLSKSPKDVCLFHELLEGVPIPLVGQCRPGGTVDARRLLSRYVDGVRRMAVEAAVDSEERKLAKWHTEDMFDWLRRSGQSGQPLDEYLNRLKFLRSQCQRIVEKASRPSIEQICAKISTLADEYSRHLVKGQIEMLTKAGIDITERPLPPPRSDRPPVGCYSSQLRFAAHRMPSSILMEQSADDQWIRIRWHGASLRFRAVHFFKLEQLYRLNCFDDRGYAHFLGRVWCLMKRYKAISEFYPLANQQSQAAGDTPSSASTTSSTALGPNPVASSSDPFRSLPVGMLEILTRDFGVTFECFTSPVGAYYRQFCSPFADTDGYFGSRGSFLDFRPREGSLLLVYPAGLTQLYAPLTSHLLSLLDSSKDGGAPLSFVCVVPLDASHCWLPSSDGGGLVGSESAADATVDALQMSSFNRWRQRPLVLAAHEHWYRVGVAQQFAVSGLPTETHVRSSSVSRLLFLQNDAAVERWPVMEDHVSELEHAFRLVPGLGQA